ncbi:MAG: hypothetical protein LBF16_03570 [Pseudomonadales bacterium]|jgi:hypothetical protein|nr:hypothetical protein [Pseudomonadales bacterium]
MKIHALTLACSLFALGLPALAQQGGGGGGGQQQRPPQDTSMSFFVTSVGLGDGANLGGLAGADAHCKALAEAAGSTGKTWHAYLSTNGAGGVNAKDRIGNGPWYNVKGVMVARNVEHLHYSNVLMSKQNTLTEKGELINGIGDAQPLQHDMLTGSNPDGTASEFTCNNWTSNGDGAAVVGHVDRAGGGAMAESWNAAHNSRGCSQEQLIPSGGNGYYYCFAVTGE